MKKYLAILLLALAGCATPSIVTPIETPGAIHGVDKPFTISEIGNDHVTTIIFLSLGLTEENAKATNDSDIKENGLQYRILTREIKNNEGVWSVRSEVEFLIPLDILPIYIPPAPKLLL